jgi:HSP20 family molecular chaperone IbpA
VKPEVKAQFVDGVLEIRLQKAVATSEGTRKVEIE